MMTNNINLEIVTWQQAQHDIQLVRNAVFVDELCIPAALERDGTGADFFYVVAKDAAGGPVGTGRIGKDGHIGCMAVPPAFRGRGLGGNMLNSLLQITVSNKLNKVCLNAQTSVTAFYAKRGFTPGGKEFEKAGVGHIKMVQLLRDD